MSASLDTCWGGERAEAERNVHFVLQKFQKFQSSFCAIWAKFQAYLPPRTKLLRIRLALQELGESPARRVYRKCDVFPDSKGEAKSWESQTVNCRLSRAESVDAKPVPGPPLSEPLASLYSLRFLSDLSIGKTECLQVPDSLLL